EAYQQVTGKRHSVIDIDMAPLLKKPRVPDYLKALAEDILAVEKEDDDQPVYLVTLACPPKKSEASLLNHSIGKHVVRRPRYEATTTYLTCLFPCGIRPIKSSPYWVKCHRLTIGVNGSAGTWGMLPNLWHLTGVIATGTSMDLSEDVIPLFGSNALEVLCGVATFVKDVINNSVPRRLVPYLAG
ncbi:unnamed protein product, partial [Prunus brigantina]